MKVLILNYECPPVGGGGGVAALQLARQWARRHTVHYITSRVRGQSAHQCVDGVHVHRADVLGRTDRSRAPLRSLLWYPVGGLAEVLKLGDVAGYDVINTHFAIPSGPLGVVVSAAYRVPNVVSVHGADIYDPTRRLSPHRGGPLRHAVRWVLRSAAAVVAQSTDTARNVAAYYGRQLTSKLHVIPLPFDVSCARRLLASAESHASALGLRPGARYLVAVGRLIRRKRFDNLILSLEHLPPDVHLVIVGEGELEEPLRELARRHGLSERVSLVGRVSEERKYAYLAACDLYVLCSEHEGFGIVLQEAMAAGLPILATSHGGQTDLLEEGRNALLLQSNEPTAIARGVSQLLSDDAHRARMSGENQKDVERYDAESIAERYVKLFRKLMRSPEG